MLRRYASTDPPVGGTAFRAEDERPWSRNQAFFLRNAICFSQVSFFFPERDGLLILFINCGVGGGGFVAGLGLCPSRKSSTFAALQGLLALSPVILRLKEVTQPFCVCPFPSHVACFHLFICYNCRHWDC